MPTPQLHRFRHHGLPILLPVIGLILVVVVVGLAVGLTLLKGNQDLGSKAAPATTLALTTANTSVAPQQTFTVAVEAHTNANLIKAVDLGLRYDKDYLELIKIEKGPFAPQGQEVVNAINAAAGMASYSLIIPTNANPPYLSGQGVLATATFRALKNTDSTRIAFAPEDTTAGAQGEETDAISLHTNLDLKITDTAVQPTPTVTAAPVNAEFFVYSYEACLNTGSNGASTYIVWNNTRYPNIKSVDISTTSDFKEFANKDVANPKSLPNGFAMTDGTNFRWYNSTKGAFTFSPEVTYYVRLFYDNRHSAVSTYKVPQCSGNGGVNYKQCNESCTSNDQCASNLYCYNSQCRRINNPDNTSCVLPPDKGIKRSCNEYCSDTTECSDGLTCWYNRCRAPQKTDDQSCNNTTTTTSSCNKYCSDSSECSNGLTCWYNRCRNAQSLEDLSCRTTTKSGPTPVVGCNQSCDTNSDCPANLRCYSNECRLLTNPTSPSCQNAVTKKQTTDKGSGGYTYDSGAQPTPKPTTLPTVSPTLVMSVTPSPSVKVQLNVSPKVSAKPTAKPTATKKLVNDFPEKTDTKQSTQKAKSPFAAVPLILGIIIIAVAAVLGVPRILSSLQAKSGQSLIAKPTEQPVQPIQPMARPGTPAQPTAAGPTNYGRQISSSTPEQK